MYCLWLNGKKIYTLQQLRASFDADAVALYCLGGGLSRWLKDCGEQDTAQKVEQIDLSRSISRQLAEIFDVDLPETEEQEYYPATAETPSVTTAGTSFASSFSDTALSLGSFPTSFNTASFAFSNAYTSFFTTSFLTTSFGSHEYEYEIGSFTTNSFSLYLSSFSAETAYSAGSFAFGSFIFGSFTTEYSSFPMESASFNLALNSFSPTAAFEQASEQEPAFLTPQQKFVLNLSSCPLNRFGYGIHLI